VEDVPVLCPRSGRLDLSSLGRPFNPHHGRRIISQLEALGKEVKAASARDAFTARFEVIKDLRDVTIHCDEYALGDGRRRDLIVGTFTSGTCDPNTRVGARTKRLD
jgi:hypothetical protein